MRSQLLQQYNSVWNKKIGSTMRILGLTAPTARIAQQIQSCMELFYNDVFVSLWTSDAAQNLSQHLGRTE